MGGQTTFLNVKNNASSLLAADITAAATSLSVSTGDGSAKFPAATFHISIDNEIMLVTVKTNDVFTVTRAQEGTSAAVHLVGAEVRLNITAKHITDLATAINAVEKYADYGLSFFGAVTTYTDTTHFKVSSLAGLGASVFLPASGTPHEIYVFKADGAAPQGEQTPVVAYTTSDGTFQHAAFSVHLAVGDEVLIIHPLLASLGTKATAAAAGAVTTTDYLMAYAKQLVTLLLNTTYGLAKLRTEIDANETKIDTMDGVVDGIQADLDNATDGLHRLLAWIQYFGDKLDDPSTGLTAIINTLVYFGNRLDDPATGLTAITNTVEAIAAYLASATFGLGALKALIETNAVLIGAKNATATADDLSDIATTDVSAKVRRLLLRFSSGAFSVSLDGSARTNLNLLYTALGVLLGTRAGTPVVGFPGTNAALPILKGLQVWQGGFVLGDITGYTDTKNFASTTLAGFETGFFNGWTCFLAKDDAGAGATPQGARAVIDTFTTTTGAIVLKTALPAAGAVGDHIILVNPILLDAWNMRGGVRSLETLGQDQDAGLDFARIQTLASPTTLDGSVQTIYSNTQGRPFYFAGGFISWDSGAWAGGESVTINVDVKVDGSNWENMWTITLAAAASPLSVAVPSHANSALLNIPMGFWNSLGVRVTVEQTAVGAGYHVVSHEFHDGVVGS